MATYWVVKLTSSPFNFFQMALFIIVLRMGVPVGLLVIKESVIWPYDWDTWTYCFVD